MYIFENILNFHLLNANYSLVKILWGCPQFFLPLYQYDRHILFLDETREVIGPHAEL